MAFAFIRPEFPAWVTKERARNLQRVTEEKQRPRSSRDWRSWSASAIANAKSMGNLVRDAKTPHRGVDRAGWRHTRVGVTEGIRGLVRKHHKKWQVRSAIAVRQMKNPYGDGSPDQDYLLRAVAQREGSRMRKRSRQVKGMLTKAIGTWGRRFPGIGNIINTVPAESYSDYHLWSLCIYRSTKGNASFRRNPWTSKY